MNCSLRSWHALTLLLVCALLGWLPKSEAADVVCTATMTNVDFGSVDLINSTGLTTSATLTYNCTNNNPSNQTYARVCFDAGDGVESSGYANPRVMKDSAGNMLQFQLFQGSGFTTVWGSQFSSTTSSPYFVDLVFAKGGTVTGSVSFQGRLVAGQTNVPPGSYQDQFTGNYTAITVNENAGIPPTTCSSTATSTFPFSAKAVVSKSCIVTATNLDFGSQNFTANNVAAAVNGAVTVTCSNSTPYTVGLSPNSTGSTVGAGTMAGTGGNTDKVPYQLYANAGLTSVWGNISGTNTIAGVGTGAAQPALPVYGKLPSANFTPDTYRDTVTVNVVY